MAESPIAGPLNPPRKQLDDEEDVLTDLAKQVGGMIEQVPYEDDFMTTEGDCSETHGSDTTAGGQTFLKNLTENIDRLHRLSHSMCLVLDDIKSRFTRYSFTGYRLIKQYDKVDGQGVDLLGRED